MLWKWKILGGKSQVVKFGVKVSWWKISLLWKYHIWYPCFLKSSIFPVFEALCLCLWSRLERALLCIIIHKLSPTRRMRTLLITTHRCIFLLHLSRVFGLLLCPTICLSLYSIRSIIAASTHCIYLYTIISVWTQYPPLSSLPPPRALGVYTNHLKSRTQFIIVVKRLAPDKNNKCYIHLHRHHH